MFSPTLVKYVLKAAARDRLAVALIAMMAVAASLSVLLGGSAVIEAQDFVLVFAAGGLRFAGVAGLVLFIVFHIRRSFDSRDVDYILTRPVSRTAFITSHAAAFSFIAILVAFLATAAVVVVAPHGFSFGTFLWAASLAGEYVIMANAALFFSMVLSSAVTGTLACLGLYAMGRLMGEILGILALGAAVPFFPVMKAAMQMISMVVPRLDLFAQTTWLVYGPGAQDAGYLFVFVQTAVYSLLLIAAALVDLVRRQF